MEDEREDADDAFRRAQLYHGELREIYRYFMPYRQATTERAGERGEGSEGASRTNHLFDGTGLNGAFNFAGMMSADWLPPFQDFFKLEAGPFVAPDQRQQMNLILSNVTEMVHAVLPQVRLTAHAMFGDLFAGTGAMYLSPSKRNSQIVRGQAVPINEIALAEGGSDEVDGIFWRRKYQGRHVPETWPTAKISNKLNEVIKKDRKKEILITQSTRYDHDEDRWFLKVYADVSCDDKDAVIFEEDYRTNPWMTPRFFKVPGESFGRGLGHLALPFVKTQNKVSELALRAAAYALIGVWMRRNDGVFNPDTAVFKPGTFFAVATTGGPLGPTLQRMPIPADFDVSTFVLKEGREEINKVLLNDELPELQDSVRSPTEIAARLRRASKYKGGAGARISLELVSALVQRTIEILEKKALLQTNITIDQIFTKAIITSPAAAAQRSDRVQWAIDWMQMIVGLAGPAGLVLVGKAEELLTDVGRWMGNDEKYMPTEADKKAFKDAIAQSVAQLQAAQKEAKQKPPGPSAPYVNGGAM